MLTGVLLGAGVKIVHSFISNWQANSHQERTSKGDSAETPELIRAKTEFLKEQNKDNWSKITKSVLFGMLTATFCYVMIYMVRHPEWVHEIAIPRTSGFFNLFDKPAWTTIRVSGAFMAFWFFTIMETVIGFYALRSKR